MSRKYAAYVTIALGFVLAFLVTVLVVSYTPPVVAAILSLLWPLAGVLFYVFRLDYKLIEFIDSVDENNQEE